MVEGYEFKFYQYSSSMSHSTLFNLVGSLAIPII